MKRVDGVFASLFHEKKQTRLKTRNVLLPDQKIRVFVSSICGDKGKFDKVRAELKHLIEETNFAEVYLFEDKGASSLSAQEHYTWNLEDCDVCIFLIDNKIGVTPGVQIEIDTVRRLEIKAIYYFCSEDEKKPTAFEKSLIGAKNAKSKTVACFDDLSKDGAKALINEIIFIYHNYCKGRLFSELKDAEENSDYVNLPSNAFFQAPFLSKATLNNIDKTQKYILNLIGQGWLADFNQSDKLKTSKIDEWTVRFLEVLFENRSIKEFNAELFLEDLKELQEEKYFNVVNFRWKAIQAYFSDEIEKSMSYLNDALDNAREMHQPSWVIHDILIDLRNQQFMNSTIKNSGYDFSAQKELSESQEDVYYPILDRMYESLQGKYIEGLFKKKTESPNTVTFGSDLGQCAALLASAFIVALYNGSLTHIILFYDKIKELLFYLCCKYDDVAYRKDLLKYALFLGKDKDVKGIIDSYPEILNNLDGNDATIIMNFCDNQPILYRRVSSQLLSFGTIGYYLDDSIYEKYEKTIVGIIKDWLNNDQCVVAVGQYIFFCLNGVAHRMSQDLIAEICCLFMDKHYSRWYIDMFRLISRKIDLEKMSIEQIRSLINHICNLIDNEEERHEVENHPSFLYVLRKQNRTETKKLNEKICEYLPDFYNGVYKLETTEDVQGDFLQYTKKYISCIKERNKSQGRHGVFSEYGMRYIATVRAMLIDKNYVCPIEIMDDLISAVSETLLVSKEGINTKIDAVSLLISVAIKYKDALKRNIKTYEKIIECQESIQDIDNTFALSNVNRLSLSVSIALLKTVMGKNIYFELLEYMTSIQNDIPTVLSVTKSIVQYLETDDNVVLPSEISNIVLQSTLQWLRLDSIDIKWNATQILLMLARNSEIMNLVNQKICNLIDTESVYTKNLILQNISKMHWMDKKTQEYVLLKCRHDPCYVVRMVCQEIQDEKAYKSS